MNTKSLVALIVTVIASSLARGADDTPSDKEFQQSPVTFTYQVPSSFASTGSKRAYLQTPAGKARYLDQGWRKNADLIAVRLFVVPEPSWQASPSQMFEGAKRSMLIDPKLELISERDYIIDSYPAHSFLFLSRQGDRPEFQRMDYILTKPDLHIVLYTSPNEPALEDSACKSFFQSISIKPKPGQK